VLSSAPSGGDKEAKQLVDKVIQVCGAVHEEDLERNMEMGRLGAEWLWSKRRQANGGEKKGLKVVTVCNTGSLATSVSDGIKCAKEDSEDWSLKLTVLRDTALPSASSRRCSKRISSTRHTTPRPRLTIRVCIATLFTRRAELTVSGSRLTSLELTTLQIPACMICKLLTTTGEKDLCLQPQAIPCLARCSSTMTLTVSLSARTEW
jgi:methylthioribose-1-phosphate isomerase